MLNGEGQDRDIVAKFYQVQGVISFSRKKMNVGKLCYDQAAAL